MNTTALDAQYRRVITARFVTKRDGSPMTCGACATPLVQGDALAATDGTNWLAPGWHSFCSTCAESFPAFVRGLFGRVRDLATEVATPIAPEAVEAVRALVADPTNDRLFLAAVEALNAARAAIGEARKAGRVAALQTDPVFVSLALATTPGLLSERDRSFADSLAEQWERKGAISAKQMVYAVKLGDKARKADAKGTVVPDYAPALSGVILGLGLVDGYYAVDHVGTIAHQDTTFVRILTNDDGLRIMRHIVGGQGEVPAGGHVWCVDVATKIVAQGVRESQIRYGQEIGRCARCHRVLTDLPSRQAGFGPVCNGL